MYVHVHVCMYMYVCMYVHVRMYVHVHVHVCMYVVLCTCISYPTSPKLSKYSLSVSQNFIKDGNFSSTNICSNYKIY